MTNIKDKYDSFTERTGVLLIEFPKDHKQFILNSIKMAYLSGFADCTISMVIQKEIKEDNVSKILDDVLKEVEKI
jgi:hypothetical protein